MKGRELLLPVVISVLLYSVPLVEGLCNREWFGTAPFCAGQCPKVKGCTIVAMASKPSPQEVWTGAPTLGALNKFGKSCATGNKVLCDKGTPLRYQTGTCPFCNSGCKSGFRSVHKWKSCCWSGRKGICEAIVY